MNRQEARAAYSAAKKKRAAAEEECDALHGRRDSAAELRYIAAQKEYGVALLALMWSCG